MSRQTVNANSKDKNKSKDWAERHRAREKRKINNVEIINLGTVYSVMPPYTLYRALYRGPISNSLIVLSQLQIKGCTYLSKIFWKISIFKKRISLELKKI